MNKIGQIKYLGKTIIPQSKTPYKNLDRQGLSLEYAFRYGQIDGGHHKQWVIDQMTRILLGTPVIFSLAKWDDGEEEYRIETGQPSKAYLDWVKKLKGDDYAYDEGIAP